VDRRDHSDLGTPVRGPDRPQVSLPAAPEVPDQQTGQPDISALPTHRLVWPGALPAAAAIVLRHPGGQASGDSPPGVSARRGRLPGAEAYARDAEQLRMQAIGIEQQLWNLSAHRSRLHARHEALRAAVGTSGTSGTSGHLEALGRKLASVTQQMASLEAELVRARAAYVSVLSEAHTHLQAARVLRHEASG
jgi:hypothetical protein